MILHYVSYVGVSFRIGSSRDICPKGNFVGKWDDEAKALRRRMKRVTKDTGKAAIRSHDRDIWGVLRYRLCHDDVYF